MFTFYDVLHETKQKRKQTLESAQYVLEIIFNVVLRKSITPKFHLSLAYCKILTAQETNQNSPWTNLPQNKLSILKAKLLIQMRLSTVV